MKKLVFKEDEYTFSELWKLYNSKKTLFSEGEVEDLNTGECFDISKFEEYKLNYTSEIYEDLKDIDEGSSLKRRLKFEADKKRLKELEESFELGLISPKELTQLIKLKYNSNELKQCMSYDHYVFLNLNTEIPDLTDGELGKFHKMLFKMTHRANELLKTKNIKSNPVGIGELMELFGVNDKSVYKFLNKLRSKNIIKEHTKDNKKYFSINPKYAINGRLNSYSYFLFKEDMEELFPNIPKEVIKLWEFEYITNTIEG